MTEIVLRVGAQRFGGWKALSVTQRFRGGAGEFSFKASERNPVDPVPRELRRGQRVEVLLGAELLATGWLDRITPSYNSRTHEIEYAGRDAVGDLIDCAALNEPGEWRGRTLDRIARDIAEPFSIPVTVDADVGEPFDKFKLEPGELAFAAIDRACRHRGVVPTSDNVGGLALTTVSTERLPFELRRGVNVVGASAEQTDRERFSLYRCIGQRRQSTDNFELNPDDAADVFGEVADTEIRRYRPRVVVAEEPGTRATLRDRAEWDKAIRRGESLSASLRVNGWAHAGGAWRPNVLVRVVDSWLAIRGDMLVTEATMSLDQSGRFTMLRVAPPEAYTLFAVPEPAEDGLELWR